MFELKEDTFMAGMRIFTLIITTALLSPVLASAQDKAAPRSTLNDLQATIQKAADKASNSLVLIYLEKRDKERALRQGMKQRLGSFGNTSEGYYTRPKGPGVGVVYNDAGIILTSIYNVAGSKGKIWVVGPDGKKREAKLLGKDPNLDIQALKVEDAAGLKPIKIADSSKLKPGKMVVLSGTSAGNEPTVTFGIVSALNRQRNQAIQISARVNYGNNGGAVTDLSGAMVAVAAFHSNAEPTGQNSGVGFAAPTHLINKVITKLAAGQDIERIKVPFLGIQAQQARPQANQRPDQKGEGVKITQVIEDSAAAKAGLKAGDVIKIFNGVEVEDFMMLVEEIRSLRVGDKILITISRSGWEKEFTVKLGERPKDVR